jgi:hypothetical protein
LIGHDGDGVPTKSKVAEPGVMVCAGLEPAITEEASSV